MKTILKTIVILAISLLLFNCGSDSEDNPTETKNPIITTISPTSGPKTTIVTINGQDFGTDVSAVSVFFNDTEGVVQAVTDTQITAVVPARAFTGKVKVVVNAKESEGPIFTYTIIDIQVSTFAGSTQGDADGSGTSAQFNFLTQIAMDSNGNIFLTDAGNNKIKKITPSGVVSTFAGSGTNGNQDGQGSSAQFYSPIGIVIDNQNNVYVADSGNYQIRKITPNGVVSTIAGNGSSGYTDGQGTAAQFRFLYGLAIDSQNNLYVADYDNHVVRKITPSGVVSTFAGSGTSGNQDGQGTDAQFKSPIGIAVDLENNLYVTDFANPVVRKITPNGLVSTFAGGTFGTADGQGTNAQFNSPTGLSVDKQGNIYVADYSNNRIRKITPNGFVSTFVGSDFGYVNGSGVNAKFNSPYSVIIDDNYDVYVSDRLNYKIRKITQE